jgi:dipeptidyl aminopeptidase/acylaminoacyl peptidase
MTPMDVARLKAVTDARISPDGALVAYTVSIPRIPGKDEDGPSWNELHLYDVSSRVQRPFVTGPVNVGDLRWAPDSGGIFYLSKRNGDKYKALYFIPARGGESVRQVQLDSDISGFDLSPDGRSAALIAVNPSPEAALEQEKQGFRQAIVEEDWKPQRLFVVELGRPGANPRELPVEGCVRGVRWSPAGHAVALSVTPTPSVDDSYMYQRVQIVDPATGAIVQKIDNPGKLGGFEWSPDGRTLALISAADLNDPAAGRLLIAKMDTGKLTFPLPDDESDVSAIAWKDSDNLVYVESHGVRTSLNSFSLGDSESFSLSGEVGPVFGSLSLSRDGSRVALTGSTLAHPDELFLLEKDPIHPVRITDSNPWLDEVSLAPQEVVQFQARDGMRLEGILIRPLGESPGQRYPLIVSVHGGPEAHETNGWLTNYSRPGQLAAARGMAVFYPNYRGSTGRGVAFSKSSQGDPAGKEFDDLVDGVDHLIQTGLVDRERVGVTGGSYGGYATAWCSTRYSDRFAAGVMFVGISNKISKVGTTDIPEEEFLVHARKRPWDNWQFFLDRSPVFHAGQGRTPLLILHGTDDPRVNVGQSRELYRHLKLRGQAPVRLVFYPGEQHGNRKAAARYDYSLRSLQWFEHYLKGPGGAPPPYELDYDLGER